MMAKADEELRLNSKQKTLKEAKASPMAQFGCSSILKTKGETGEMRLFTDKDI
jgi:hypothetical protein